MQHVVRIRKNGHQVKVHLRSRNKGHLSGGVRFVGDEDFDEDDVFVDAVETFDDETDEDWLDASSVEKVGDLSISRDSSDDDEEDDKANGFLEVFGETEGVELGRPDGDSTIPTTNASVPVVDVRSRDERVHLHTILNNSASVLV